jgi:dTDP-4-dehydrorhamnose reductase
MTRRVAVIGAAGQLGTDLMEMFGDQGLEAFPLDREDLLVEDIGSLRSALAPLRPDAVVNTAAFHSVDDAEHDPSEAFLVNATGAGNVAIVAAELDAAVVFISSDYVFDGGKAHAYVESDATNPLNLYGVSKQAGELATRIASNAAAVIRVSSLFGQAGATGKGGNFVETILTKARAGDQLEVVDDMVMTPTYTRDAADVIAAVVATGATGVFHGANGGECSWYEFACAAIGLAGLHVPIKPVDSSFYGSPVRRPAYSAMRTERAGEIGLGDPRPWREALEAYLDEKGHLAS